MTYRKRKNAGKRYRDADEARTFEKISVGNAATLMQAAADHGCTCQPYADWFTYGRWQAQGMHVRKGEHGTALTVIIEKEGENGEAKTYPKRAYVFCRCQVEANEVKEVVRA